MFVYIRFNTKCQVYKCEIFADLIKIFQFFVILYTLSWTLFSFSYLFLFALLLTQKSFLFVSLSLCFWSDLFIYVDLFIFLSFPPSLYVAVWKTCEWQANKKKNGTKTNWTKWNYLECNIHHWAIARLQDVSNKSIERRKEKRNVKREAQRKERADRILFMQNTISFYVFFFFSFLHSWTDFVWIEMVVR